MPFSQAITEKNQKIKIATLQVRTLFNRIKSYGTKEAVGKKVFLSASGAVTVEAALCLSLFIFAATCMMLPMKIMNTERQIQASLEQAGEDLSRYAYLKDAAEKGKVFASAGAGDFAKGFTQYLVGVVGEGYAQTLVQKHVETSALQQISMAESEIMTDGEFVDLVMDYQIRFPFPVLGVSALDRTARCRRRAWIGKAGKDYGEGGDTSEADDPIVYVGKGSTRYHRKRSCHYLSNNLTTVSRDSVDAMRNKNGSKYRPCAVCGKQAGETVYIMPSGESYHTDAECSAIIAYVRAVRLSEVEYLGPCSYCSR
jgi:hypothetical protein